MVALLIGHARVSTDSQDLTAQRDGAIVEELTVRQVRLSLGGSLHDPLGPVGRLPFNVLAMVAEFEADLIRMRTREGTAVARAKGHLRAKKPIWIDARKPTWRS